MNNEKYDIYELATKLTIENVNSKIFEGFGIVNENTIVCYMRYNKQYDRLKGVFINKYFGINFEFRYTGKISLQ